MLYTYFEVGDKIRKDYSSVSLPKDFLVVIDSLIQDETLGYSSRASFIKKAIRTQLKEEADQIPMIYNVIGESNPDTDKIIAEIDSVINQNS